MMNSQEVSPMDDEEKSVPRVRRRDKLKDHGKDFMGKTSVAGLPQIYNSNNKIKQIFWLLALIIGLALCIYFIAKIFIKYYSYPVSTSVTTVTQLYADMPAVTFCNVFYMSDAGLEKFGKNNSINFTYPDSLLDENFTYQKFISQLTYAEKEMVGFHKDHLLQYCSFGTRNCSDDDTDLFINTYYGNCFTLPSINDTNTWFVNTAGQSKGALSMLFNIDSYQKSYQPNELGIVLQIHNKSYTPSPGSKGLLLSPGMSWYLSMEREDIEVLEPPYDYCENIEGEDLFKYNVWYENYPFLTYTREACLLSCFQLKVVENCDCYDVYVEYSEKSFNQTNVAPCVNDVQVNCSNVYWDKFVASEIGCTDYCPIQCYSSDFKITTSAASFPNPMTADTYIQYLTPGQRNATQSDEEDLKMIKENLVSVYLYFSTLNTRVISQAPSYQMDSVLNDLGGQLGLWIGLSVMTIFELVEFILDFFGIISRRNR